MVVFLVFLGLLFDYTNGFHDSANVVSTVIATKVLRPLAAILFAAFFNFLGATQVSAVAQTITEGLLTVSHVSQLLVIASLMGAILWNIFTWYFGIPSSSSYALIGGMLGGALYQKGVEMVLWKGFFLKVITPMIVSPILGFVLAFSSLALLSRYVKTGRHKLFSHLQLISSALVALSHGMNDAQKSMGIITLGLFSANVLATPEVPVWVVGLCALVMALGTASGGFRIIRTLGYKVTPLDPKRGFVVETSASLVILLASFLGMPISSTHMIVGSVAGVGVERSKSSVNVSLLRKIALTWIFTFPGAGAVSYFLLYLLTSFN